MSRPSPDPDVSSGGTQAPTRLLTMTDLPIGRTDIELTAPGTELVLADGAARPKKIMALVRVHTHPVGVVILDGTLGLSWSAHASTVWAAVREAVDAHLLDDALPVADHSDALAPPPASARCRRTRERVLAQAPPTTVVVATRDRPDSVRDCLAALLNMEYSRFEIVVVDNDPTTTETANLVAAMNNPSVRYVREGRRGLSSAHNRGLEEAHGEIIAFIDDDVIADRHWLSAIAEGFAADERVGCVTGLILPEQLETPAQLLLEQHGGFDKGLELKVFDTDLNRPADPLFPFTAGRFGSGANMAFDSAVLRRLGGFDPAIGVGTYARGGDDLAGFFRVVTAGHRLVYQPSAVVWHRHHRDMAALRNQAYGYGVGLGAFITSAVVNDPRTLGGLLRRLPRGIGYLLHASSDRNLDRYDGLPDDLAGLEKRGVLFGPAAYTVSRWRGRNEKAGNRR